MITKNLEHLNYLNNQKNLEIFYNLKRLKHNHYQKLIH